MSNNTINACICELNISVWTARKHDKTASREVKRDKGHTAMTPRGSTRT
jgi:hypothetical protein